MPPLEIDFSPQFRRRARQLSEDQRKQAASAADSLREVFAAHIGTAALVSVGWVATSMSSA